MLQVIVPMAALLIIVIFKKIPYIGGNVKLGLFVAGALTLLLAGMFNPSDWFAAWIDGLNRLSWIIALSVFGSLFAEVSSHIGTIDTIIGAFTAKFGRHPRILLICILFALTLAGSLLGDAIAAATVIGMLTVGILASMNLELEKICAIIIMGAVTGSIMPPMTQALAMASSLAGANPDEVINMGYITISIVFVVISVYTAVFLVTKNNYPGANKEVEIKFSDQKAGKILRKNWKSLIPMCVLILIVLLRTVDIPAISVDLGPSILKQVKFITLPEGDTVINLYDWLSNVTILSGVTNGVVLSIICAFVFSFVFPAVRSNGGQIVREGLSKVKGTVMLQVFCSFMLGSFYLSGSIDIVSEFCKGLDNNVLKIGGVLAILLVGMLTGSQSTAQNVIFSFFGPALVATGMSATAAALVGAHVATGAQCLPGANLTGFVVVGIVSAQFGKKVDPIKSMLYCLPLCAIMTLIGLFFLFIY